MANIEAIEEAVADLNSQETFNIRFIAKKYSLVESTLQIAIKTRLFFAMKANLKTMLLTNV